MNLKYEVIIRQQRFVKELNIQENEKESLIIQKQLRVLERHLRTP